MPDPTLTALLAAVIADPADDMPRLLYADRCEELGDDARAEFIRVQMTFGNDPYWEGICRETCEAPEFDGCPQRGARKREWELFHGEEARTLAWFSLPQPWARIARLEPFETDDTSFPYAVVRRGFVEHVILAWEDWRDHAEAILAAQPVTDVTLKTLPDNNALHGLWLWTVLPTKSFLSENPRLPAENDHITRSWTLFFLGEIWPRIRKWSLPSLPALP